VLGVDNSDLIAECAAVIDEPKADPATSFVLHAPLELLARALLLERAPEAAIEPARRRLRWLADEYRAAGAAAPAEARRPPNTNAIVVSLAAAGHGSILLTLRRRVAAVDGTFGDGLLALEVARHPAWVLRWPSQRATEGTGSGDLEERLAAPPSPGDTGSSFIYPTMSLTESSGLAEKVLDDPLRGMDVPTARTALLRVAARSMLQDTPDAAPYGWTHCLTMPQAALDAVDLGADPAVAVAVAATYVLGFRSTLGRVGLDPDHVPAADTPAGRIWRADDDALRTETDVLVAFGLAHADAHVAKYTLACLDAADTDPAAARLHLAACAHLQAWWRAAAPADEIVASLA
jgi:hypothetical protein